MIVLYTFMVLQFLVSGYACWRGGAPERLVGGLLVVVWLATVLAPWDYFPTYTIVDRYFLGLDTLLFVALMAIALLADRFWPIWLAAFQLVAVAGHGVKGYNTDLIPYAYFWVVTKIAYPMLVILFVGTWRHQERLRRGMPEFGWTFQRRRFDERPDHYRAG